MFENIVVHPLVSGGFRVTCFEDNRAKGEMPFSKRRYTAEVLRVHEFVKQFKAYKWTEGGADSVDSYEAVNEFEIPQVRKVKGMRGKKVQDHSCNTNYMPKGWEESISVLFGPCVQYSSPLKATLKAFGVDHKPEFRQKVLNKAFKNKTPIEYGDYYDNEY